MHFRTLHLFAPQITLHTDISFFDWFYLVKTPIGYNSQVMPHKTIGNAKVHDFVQIVADYQHKISQVF